MAYENSFYRNAQGRAQGLKPVPAGARLDILDDKTVSVVSVSGDILGEFALWPSLEVMVNASRASRTRLIPLSGPAR